MVPSLVALLLFASCVAEESSVEPIRLGRVATDDLSVERWQPLVELRRSCLAQARLNPNPCARLYSDSESSWLLVEVCEPTDEMASGIHLVARDGSRLSYPWFDQQFSEWTCNEECNSPDACYYELLGRPGGKAPAELTHHFDINLSYGSYRLRLGPDGVVIVIEASSTDLPS